MIRINLLPHKKVKPVEKGIIRLWVAAIALAVVLLGGLGVWYVLLSSGMGELTDQKAALDTELVGLQKKLAQVKDFEEKRKDYENKLAIIDQIEKIKIPLTPVLFELNRLVAKDVWVDSLSVKDASFTVGLKSLKRESINPFFDTLQKSRVFSNLSLDADQAFSPKMAGSQSYPFTVKGKIAGYEEVKRPKAD